MPEEKNEHDSLGVQRTRYDEQAGKHVSTVPKKRCATPRLLIA